MPSPIFTSLLLVLMIQKTHGREIQYLKQEGLLSRRLSSSLSPARLRFLAACWVTLLWQLSVGWELHHGANDRIIMKRLTSDVLERRARCQGTKPAHCSAWRRLYNTYPRHHEHRERTSPSFLCGGLTLAPTTPLPPPPPPQFHFQKGRPCQRSREPGVRGDPCRSAWSAGGVTADPGLGHGPGTSPEMLPLGMGGRWERGAPPAQTGLICTCSPTPGGKINESTQNLRCRYVVTWSGTDSMILPTLLWFLNVFSCRKWDF